MGFIRVLEHPSRCMQRLGYIKYVLSRGAATSTSSLEKLGHELVKTARFDIAHYEPFLDALCGSREYQQCEAIAGNESAQRAA